MEKWNELCYLLSENLTPNTSEQLFESKVVQAFEKLGWSEFNKEIKVRESHQIGASNRISPDLIFKTNQKGNLFIVEVKKPSLEIDYKNFENQLSSYMGVLRLQLGILIGKKIKLYIDGSLFNKEGILLIDEIEFKRENKKGLEFINLFQKETFDVQKVISYATLQISNRTKKEQKKLLKKELIDGLYTERIKKTLKNELLSNYSVEVVENAINEIEITFLNKSNTQHSTDSTNKDAFNIIKMHNNLPNSQNSSNVKIGRYVQTTFSELVNSNKLKQEEINKLQNADYCKKIFDIQFPFLQKKFIQYTELRKRYWRNPILIFGEEYYMCSQWYEVPANNDRPFYENWLKKMKLQ